MTIQYENSIFRDLITTYKTWEDLKLFLESEEGGLFRVVDKNENGFCLIRYEKGVSKMDLPHSKWFRSVVWDTNKNIPVCVAPPKTSSDEFSFKTFKDMADNGIVCQELLDGFMINCYRVEGDSTIYATSRSKLDASGKFYSEKSFRDLFYEADNDTNPSPSSSDIYIPPETRAFRFPNTDKDEAAVFCSFLVQHTDHRIVKPIKNNSVYLIHRGVVFNDGRIEFEDSPEIVTCSKIVKNIVPECIITKGSYAQITAKSNEENDTTSEVENWIKSYLSNMSWEFQGLVFKDKLGNRWRFKSEKYTAVKSLRGNTPIIRDRFSQLYVQNLVHKYLEYYPEDAVIMTIHYMFINSLIQNLYDLYVKLHITKQLKIDEIDKVYWPHLYNIHGIYLSQLRPENKKITYTEIQMYLHKQPWQRISFLIKTIVDKSNNTST
jgi:hypothetical protein